MQETRPILTHNPDISLITSLYHSATYLPRYVKHVASLVQQVVDEGLSIELIIVANQPTIEEVGYFVQIEEIFHKIDQAFLQILEVPRETIYASWNRGVEASHGSVIGFLNADDERDAAGLIEAHHYVDQQKCQLFYSDFQRKVDVAWPAGLRFRHTFIASAIDFDAEKFAEKMRVGPFFMFTPELYQQVGAFDANFKISGDFDWIVRAIPFCEFCRGSANLGTFYEHGANLSSGFDARMLVEDNIIYLRHGYPQYLKPVPPEMMRQIWESWGGGAAVGTLAEEHRQFLWGKGAQGRWNHYRQAYLQNKLAKQRSQAIRKYPRKLVDRFGLRPYLEKLGLSKGSSAATHRGQ
ncbi:hypothetical protein MASR2M15_28570 [Anaerolineales bacterium]